MVDSLNKLIFSVLFIFWSDQMPVQQTSKILCIIGYGSWMMPLKIDKKTSLCCSKNADLTTVEVSWSTKESINWIYNVRISEGKGMQLSRMVTETGKVRIYLVWREYLFGRHSWIFASWRGFLIETARAEGENKYIIINMDKLLFPKQRPPKQICVLVHRQNQT